MPQTSPASLPPRQIRCQQPLSATLLPTGRPWEGICHVSLAHSVYVRLRQTRNKRKGVFFAGKSGATVSLDGYDPRKRFTPTGTRKKHPRLRPAVTGNTNGVRFPVSLFHARLCATRYTCFLNRYSPLLFWGRHQVMRLAADSEWVTRKQLVDRELRAAVGC